VWEQLTPDALDSLVPFLASPNLPSTRVNHLYTFSVLVLDTIEYHGFLIVLVWCMQGSDWYTLEQESLLVIILIKLLLA
jgi:hypothetical protein